MPASFPASAQTLTPAGAPLVLPIAETVEMRLELIPAGKFVMGSPAAEIDRADDEGPQHEVTISKPFYIGAFLVTQEQYEVVMAVPEPAPATTQAASSPSTSRPKARAGQPDDEVAAPATSRPSTSAPASAPAASQPSFFKGPKNPVERVSWVTANEFCRRLSQKTGRTVRLPTEAEWEYACRAGTITRFYYGDDLEYVELPQYAWFDQDSAGKTHPVAQKKPNALALFDMHGHVWEWCSDYYMPSYADSGSVDPTGPATGQYRVLRGGCWDRKAAYCRSAARYWFHPDIQLNWIGFRVVVEK
jgi:formylglycine-generating enzyme required for sulfatase activity